MQKTISYTLLFIGVVSLSGCISVHDKDFVNSLDCKGLQDLQRENPTSSQAIIRDWDEDRISDSSRDRDILNQSRSQQRDSAARRSYAKKC